MSADVGHAVREGAEHQQERRSLSVRYSLWWTSALNFRRAGDDAPIGTDTANLYFVEQSRW